MSNTVHRISGDGERIVCESDPNAFCRMAPDCDSETWQRDGSCHDHREMIDGYENPWTGHPVTPGHACWLAERHINPAGLDDTHDDWVSGAVHPRPGALVEIEFHGPYDGASWDYVEEANDG